MGTSYDIISGIVTPQMLELPNSLKAYLDVEKQEVGIRISPKPGYTLSSLMDDEGCFVNIDGDTVSISKYELENQETGAKIRFTDQFSLADNCSDFSISTTLRSRKQEEKQFMSDVEIQIRNTILQMMAARPPREITIETIQEVLKADLFFTSKGINPVPAEWIEPIMEDEIANSTGPYSE